MNAIWRGFLTPVLTTSCDGKRVKIANLGIVYSG
nr:MAG TPA: HU domain protein [Caudoviricetes sp.]